jgi:hypothetical protein
MRACVAWVSDCYRSSESRSWVRFEVGPVRELEGFECSEIRDRIRGLDGERTLTDSREVQRMLPTELEYNTV